MVNLFGFLLLSMAISTSTYAADCGGALIITNFIGAKIAEFKADQFELQMEAELRQAGVDMLIVEAPSVADRHKMRADQGFYYKPQWITWSRSALSRDAFLASLKSKERSRIKTKLKNSGDRITVEYAPLTVADFLRWHTIYAEDMQKKERGRVALSATWAEEKGADLKRYQRLFFRDSASQELIGGVILRPHAKDKVLQAPFAAYRDKYKNYDMPLRSFIEVMEHAVNLKYSRISYGRDTNLYGHHLSIGLMEYKASLGFEPAPERARQIFKVLNPKILNDEYFFFGLDGEQLVPLYFTKTPRALILPPGFSSPTPINL